MKMYITSDSWPFYEQRDGSLTDDPDPDKSDLGWDNVNQMMEWDEQDSSVSSGVISTRGLTILKLGEHTADSMSGTQERVRVECSVPQSPSSCASYPASQASFAPSGDQPARRTSSCFSG